ncbi:hypothetical protein [Parafrankia sp. EUN1f]|uniref:hypothetical protein n=1 Tax=Parafrankia sp. EUN1f TaxID=102897 RepID=UPI001E383217|nr:hypothetical protein [Parafrankia sp. EUN1f]
MRVGITGPQAGENAKALLFPDNTVLINFAIIGRMDLLEKLANGRGRWCATVASECDRSARKAGLDELVRAHDIFGPPLSPSPAELAQARRFRAELASPGDRPYQHLGEAETVAIMLRRRLQAFFVTDDRSAAQLAAREGIKVVTTWDLLKIATRRAGWIDADDLWGYVQILRTHRRGGLAQVKDRPSFDKWLAS